MLPIELSWDKQLDISTEAPFPVYKQNRIFVADNVTDLQLLYDTVMFKYISHQSPIDAPIILWDSYNCLYHTTIASGDRKIPHIAYHNVHLRFDEFHELLHNIQHLIAGRAGSSLMSKTTTLYNELCVDPKEFTENRLEKRPDIYVVLFGAFSWLSNLGKDLFNEVYKLVTTKNVSGVYFYVFDIESALDKYDVKFVNKEKVNDYFYINVAHGGNEYSYRIHTGVEYRDRCTLVYETAANNLCVGYTLPELLRAVYGNGGVHEFM